MKFGKPCLGRRGIAQAVDQGDELLTCQTSTDRVKMNYWDVHRQA